MQAFLKTLAAILAATKKHAIPLTLTLSVTALFVVLYYTSTAPAYPNPASETSDSPATIAPDGQQTDDTVPNPYINAPAFVPIVNTSTEVNVKGGSYNGGATPGINKNVADILKRDNPYGTAEDQHPAVFKNMPGACAPGSSGSVADLLAQGQRRSQQTLTSLSMQAAEQGNASPQLGTNNILTTNLGSVNETYRGYCRCHYNDDVIGNLFSQIGQLIGKWLSEYINGWIADSVQYISRIAMVLLTETELSILLYHLKIANTTLTAISLQILLVSALIFSRKKTSSSVFPATTRNEPHNKFLPALLFPVLLISELCITLTCARWLFAGCAEQLLMLDTALASAVRGGILAGVGGLASFLAPIFGGLGLGIVGGTVGEICAFTGLIVFALLGTLLILQLIQLIGIRASQIALLAGQMLLHPLLTAPAKTSTQNHSRNSDYLTTWVTTIGCSVIWLLLLKTIVLIAFSPINPWFKIILTSTILHLMIRTPRWLRHAHLSSLWPRRRWSLLNYLKLPVVSPTVQPVAVRSGYATTITTAPSFHGFSADAPTQLACNSCSSTAPPRSIPKTLPPHFT